MTTFSRNGKRHQHRRLVHPVEYYKDAKVYDLGTVQQCESCEKDFTVSSIAPIGSSKLGPSHILVTGY